MKRSTGWAMALLAWVMLLSLAGAQAPKANAIPDAEYAKLVAQQIQGLTEALRAAVESSEPLEKKRLADKARSVAVIIAQAAQDNLAGKDAEQRAALRDAALAIVKQLPASNPALADALKQAEALAGVKPGPATKKEPIALLPAHSSLETVMVPYKLPTKGGQGLESLLLKLSFSKKKALTEAQLDDALLLAAHQSALIAEMTRAHQPKGQDPKKWVELSDDMRRTSRELAAGVRGKDGKAAFAALVKLNESCAACHKLYRDADQ